MYRNKTIAVIIPAYNEERQITGVIETVPAFVDHVVVVDDGSTDRSAAIVESLRQNDGGNRLVLLKNPRNEGCGGALVRGYQWAIQNGIDITARMDGDGQMVPEELPKLLDPIIDGKTDYTKGNRLSSGEAYRIMPKVRYFGNAVLSLLTKIASGYWHIADAQCGYSAIDRRALATVDWGRMYRRYGQPNDLLILLNIYNFRVQDVPVTPLYNVGEKSRIHIPMVIPRISWMLIKGFSRRLKEKYVIRDFHPLIFCYALGVSMFFPGVGYGWYLMHWRIFCGPVAATGAIFAAFLVISGLQLLFFAMLFDMEYNRSLK